MKFEIRYKKYLLYILAILAFIIIGSLIPNFLQPRNLLNVMRQCSIIAICSIAMTMVIIIKGIDLSIGGQISLCAMINGLLLLQGVSLPIAIIVGLVVGTLMGMFNGLMVSKLEVPSFIATLAVGQVCYGFALLLNNGRSIGGFPEAYVFIGNGKLLGIPVSDYITLLLVMIGAFVMTRTPFGNHVYALGGNEVVVKQEGINTNRIKLMVFAISGFCAAAAGILLSSQLDTVHPMQGEPYQLDTIAACVIGGVNMMGGEGKIPLSLVGALIIGCARNALNLLGIHPFFQNIIVGTIIIIVVAVSIYSKNKKLEASKVY
ncbi:ABC transporter permease [Biomaibacter acetigenes]|uniref:Autoinducer 2 import system permease protein LsrD n=1 Tax=Biomaibacter acetigenes TaxID=2316383 RepID=A0A3G2R7I2_9FIRM|nr:ABC transporter permease [Biomaibacter acetigenes]AYO31335.1 ABC transporter permease [Biomaibacter acetigenes]